MPNEDERLGGVPGHPGHHLDIGPGQEFDLVRRLEARWGARARGLGDDAAVLDAPVGSHLVVSTDTAVEGVHFRTDWLTPEEIGYRTTTGALSDLAAMGARSLGITVAMALPVTWLPRMDALAEGIGAAADVAGAPIVGGDLTRSDALVLTFTVLGTAARPVSRGGARPGDVVYVTGALGGPAAALRAWRAGRPPDAVHRARFAAPAARIDVGAWLAELGVTAMIDISDGLASEARHLAAASHVLLDVTLDRVPLLHGITPLEAALSGEEYELLLTAPAGLDLREVESRFGVPLTAIGEVQAAAESGPQARFTLGGARVDLAQGYDHFSS